MTQDVVQSFAFCPTDGEVKAQRLAWGEATYYAMDALGLQAVFCKTKNGSPMPMPDSTGGAAEFGVYVEPDKAYTRPAFRMPPYAIALDVDHKPGKGDGWDTIRAVEAELGELPPTQRLTARGADQTSGRYLFRIPAGFRVDERFFKSYGGNVDVVRTAHRFSMAPGDIHPGTGEPVVCYGPDGTPEELLAVDRWPLLPLEWLMDLELFNETHQEARLSDTERDDLDGLMTREQAEAVNASALDSIRFHDTAGSGFRALLQRTSITVGGFVGSLYAEPEQAEEALYEAIQAVWDAEPDADDQKLVTSGVEIGAARAWTVVDALEVQEPEETAPGSEAEPAHKSKILLTDVKHAVDWLRSECGRRGLNGLFLRAGRIVKVVEVPPVIARDNEVVQHDGFQQVAEIDKPGKLISHADLSGYKFFRPGGKDTPPKPKLLDLAAAAVCIDTPEGLPHLRTLRGVTGTPIIRADGSILNAPGYDAATELLYKPDSEDLVVPPVADAPTPDDVAAARELLEYMVADFAFVTDDHRASYLGALMLPLVRALVPPPYKLLAIDAYAPGSGKTLLADILRTIHHGRRGSTPGGAFRSEWPKAEEFQKWVTSVLMSGSGGVVHVDNVKATIGSGELEGLMTSASYGGRVLGRTEVVEAMNDRLWVVTGNNIQISGDMARRVLWVQIDPGQENPEQRRPEEFREADLVGWVFRNRGRIIHAVLTLARAWYAAGADRAPATTSDTFGVAVGVVQGILKFSGITGTFDPTDRRASEDQNDFSTFLRAMKHWQDGREDDGPWKAAELARAINSEFDDGELADAMPDFWRKGPTISPGGLGKRLDRNKGAWHSGMRLVPWGRDRVNVMLWRVEER